MNTLNNSENLAWYKQFWPLFLIALPGSVIIACIFLIVISFEKADDVISNDYYQKGLNINQVLAQMEEAKTRQLRFNARIENNTLYAVLEGNTTEDEILTLSLSETTDKLRDTSISLLRQEDGSFKGTLPASIRSGRFYADVSPLDNPIWLIKSVIYLPAESLQLSP